LPRFSCPALLRSQVVAGGLWESGSQTFSAAAIR
jgi:hypothetical protein